MKLFSTALTIFLIVLWSSTSVNAHAHMPIDASNSEQLIEQQPSMFTENMPLPIPNLIQGVFAEHINENPDVSAITEPGNGNDPNAPIDAHVWFLLLLVAVFGTYQYKLKKIIN